MELYLSIALGIFIGEIGKKAIQQAEDWWWKFKHRNDPPSPLSKWLGSLDEEDTI